MVETGSSRHTRSLGIHVAVTPATKTTDKRNPLGELMKSFLWAQLHGCIAAGSFMEQHYDRELQVYVISWVFRGIIFQPTNSDTYLHKEERQKGEGKKERKRSKCM
jgi:hypothetical protein